MKKNIRIKFVGFWSGFNPDNFFVTQCLKKRYNVQIVDEGQEYIVCSMLGEPYEYCKYPQPRIMYSGENYIPDFNLVDYSICSYPINFFDRNFRVPIDIDCNFGLALKLTGKNRDYSFDILKEKKYFANFIASHESEYNLRGAFFKKLSMYKRIESCGSYLNNMPNGERVNRNSKIDFQRKTKFTICFESTKHEGFLTEKITDAFYADTIPIYYGSSDVKTIFNEKAFINCSDYNNFDDVIKKIIELDNDDNKYMEMLHQPIFVDEKYPDKLINELEEFLYHIFDPPVENAYRRSRVYSAKHHNDYLIEVKKRIDINALSIKGILRMLIVRIIRKVFK